MNIVSIKIDNIAMGYSIQVSTEELVELYRIISDTSTNTNYELTCAREKGDELKTLILERDSKIIGEMYEKLEKAYNNVFNLKGE